MVELARLRKLVLTKTPLAASMHVFAIFVFVVVALPMTTGAIEHIVGEDIGWTVNFNYAAWASGKEFRVRDKLVFKYPIGLHDVRKVGADNFKACTMPAASVDPLTSGDDVVTLTTPGKQWYICGKAGGAHCMLDQKLAIDVLPVAGEAPAPSPVVPIAVVAPVLILAPSEAESPSYGVAPGPGYWSRKLL